MRVHHFLVRAVGVVAVLGGARNASAIGASSDTAKPSQTTTYQSGSNFNIFENVTLDSNFGPWHKLLTNADGGHPSGQNQQINEMLTNTGVATWTDWFERVVSRTTVNQTDDTPGFLFTQGSLVVRADYGTGLQTLTAGSQYTLTPTTYTGPGNGGGTDNWEALKISFAPGFEIAPGDTLQIQKQIFEVFGDANIWQGGESAEIAEFPSSVPEPAGTLLGAIGSLSLLTRRRRHCGH